jgi:hypothetical protein
MRRSSLSWLLSLLLVLVQHGALLHGLSHLSHGEGQSGVTVRADPQAMDGGPCLTCAAYAQVANPVAVNGGSPAVCPAELLPTPEPRYRIIAADAPTPRNRGPPQV